MSGFYLDLAWAVAVGCIATGFMDLGALGRRWLFGSRSLDWALVGRWLGHLGRGQLVLARPGEAAPIRGERLLGWGFHYGVGIALAGLLRSVLGAQAIEAPQALPIISFGLVTVLLPMLTLQPGLGLGLAARLAPAPWAARRASLLTHFTFGLGLYLGAVGLAVALS
ncbi:DUF2938 family protein [Pseudophaeobacter sp.]|uniref:DUF2938 family protein n=1 Tax=Pseudophaeobacter sp. TaxID=1971739 RepID=UPI0032985B61